MVGTSHLGKRYHVRKARDHRKEYEALKQRATQHGFSSVRAFKRSRKAEPTKFYSPRAIKRYKIKAAQDWSDRRARMPIAEFNYNRYVDEYDGDPDIAFAEYVDAYYAAFVDSYDDDRDDGSDALYNWLVVINDWSEEEYNDKYGAE